MNSPQKEKFEVLIKKDISSTPILNNVDSTEEKSGHYWSKRDKLRWTVLFFFGSVIVYAVRVSMSISASSVGKELGWNKQISGMALSAFFCGYVCTNVLGGYVSDRIGGQTVILYTSIGWGTLTMLLPYCAHTESVIHSGTMALLFCRFLTGVCQGAFYPSVTSILTKHVPVSERGSILGLVNSGMAIGTTATGFLGSLIVEHLKWDYLFQIVGLLGLLWTLWLRYVMKISPGVVLKGEEEKQKEPVPWVKLASHAPFWALLVAYFLNSYCFFNLLSWAPLYFHDSFPESKGWVFNVIPWLVNFVLSIVCGYVADAMIRKGHSTTFVRKLFSSLMFMGTCVFSLLLNTVESFKQALFMMSLNIGVLALNGCSCTINPTDLAPRHAGALHGLINSCGAFVGFVGVYFTGYVLETTGKWSSIFSVTAASAVIGGLAFQICGSGERIL